MRHKLARHFVLFGPRMRYNKEGMPWMAAPPGYRRAALLIITARGASMSVEPKPIRLSPTGKFITVAIIVALAVLIFSAVGSILTPFVAAVITAYLFNPLIGWLHRRTGLGRGVWIGVLYVMVGALAYAL